ncbi:unnamed protein product [Nippostrongylus brasiliensis]|uniref:Ovule protein n=1 Tax=Nippostrongylus brasiliensis TaxID=27835 RepID=A0A0N4YZ44_NIPBR|nr:unnamed protein product [Nippostrongylus brasiliensis]
MVEAAREPGEYYYYVLTTPNLEFLRTSEKIDYDDDWSQFSSSNSTDDDYVYDEALHGGHTSEESMKEHNHKKDEL